LSDTSRPTLLTIAGHDPSAGAGITADLAVFAAQGFFGTSCVTALTVQSTMGVERVLATDAETLRDALHCLSVDMPPSGVKVGMLGSAAAAQAVADFLQTLELGVPVVVDPVLRSSSGRELASPEAVEILRKDLLRSATWATPNIAELSLLLQRPLANRAEIEDGAAALLSLTGLQGVVVTNGDGIPPHDFVSYRDSRDEIHSRWIEGERIETQATHGTGCAFSSALLCQLVLGKSGVDAAIAAKSYVAEAMRRATPLGRGKGPMHLLWPLDR